MCAQARFYPGTGSCADGSDLIWKMLQILEKGNERDWVVTIVKVCSSLPMHRCSRHMSDESAITHVRWHAASSSAHEKRVEMPESHQCSPARPSAVNGAESACGAAQAISSL